MYYKYDSKTLTYTKVNYVKFGLKSLIVLIIIFLVFGFSIRSTSKINVSEKEIELIVLKQNEFTKEKFIDKIKSLNFKFPHIVLAQAMLETNNFKSQIFLENNNLFGMKEATMRIRTAKGTQFNHAYYDNWMESLYDYAFYSSKYLSDITTENDYLSYLGQSYAQDKEYVVKIMNIINQNRLKEVFVN